MEDTFCLTVTGISGKYISTFQASNGEEYTVQFNENIIDAKEMFQSEDIMSKNLTIRWGKVSSKFIRLSCYQRNGYKKLGERMVFVEDETRACFNFGRQANMHAQAIVFGSLSTFSNHAFSDDDFYCTQALSKYVFVLNIVPHIPLVDEVNFTLNAKPTKTEPVIKKNIDQLLLGMQNLFETGNLSDVVLTDGSEDIQAHKIILSTRCSAFARMFEHPMKENRENRVTIDDISIDVLKEMLRFMYTGTVVIKDSKMAQDLYVASDKYDLKDLRDICSGELKSVDVFNVLDILFLSDLCNDKILKEAALLFISNNYSQLKALDNWNDFMKEHQSLALEALSFVIDKKI